MKAALLHTVPALEPVFDELVLAERGDLELVHAADPELLSSAIDHGMTDELRERVAAHIERLAASGAEAILVTCSSIGEAVEAAAAHASVPVLRVDAPMAREAAAIAASAAASQGRQGVIAVLATLHATLVPTGNLVRSAVDASSADSRVTATVVAGAAAARAGGDNARHDRLVAEAIQRVAAEADVVVLAQASMAQAVAGVVLDIPVLSSPTGGAASLVAALGGGRQA